MLDFCLLHFGMPTFPVNCDLCLLFLRTALSTFEFYTLRILNIRQFYLAVHRKMFSSLLFFFKGQKKASIIERNQIYFEDYRGVGG